MDFSIEDDSNLVKKIKTMTSLLREAHEYVGVAIGVELEYGDYVSVERLKNLRKRIEEEISLGPTSK